MDQQLTEQRETAAENFARNPRSNATMSVLEGSRLEYIGKGGGTYSMPGSAREAHCEGSRPPPSVRPPVSRE